MRELRYAGFKLWIETEPGHSSHVPDNDREHPRAQHLVPYAYGFFAGTEGKDGEEVDVHLGPDEAARTAYVIDCNVPGDREDKVMLGFSSREEALRAFSAAYQGGGEKFIEGVREMSHAELREFLKLEGRPVDKTSWFQKSAFVSFPAVFKELKQDEQGTPIVRFLVSGTKLDSQGYEYQGVRVLGEKVQVELLTSMKEQAEAGSVYLIENHGATLRLGVSRAAEVLEAGTDQELFVEFELFPDNPMVPFFLKDQQRGYVPDCSVGIFVKREISWDTAENGYVGKLLEGRFEHVALTRPNHGAYPDAEISEVFLENSLAEACKSLLAAPNLRERARARGLGMQNKGIKAAERREGGSMAASHVAGGAGTRTVKEAKADEPKPNPQTEEELLERKKEADMAEMEAAKAKEAEECKAKEAEAAEMAKKAEEEKEAGGVRPPPQEDVAATPPPEKEPPPAPGSGKEGEGEGGGPKFSLKDAAEHARNMAGLVQEAVGEGSNPQDAFDLLTDIQQDFEILCQMLEGMGGGAPPADGTAPDAGAGKDEMEAGGAPPPGAPPGGGENAAPAEAPGGGAPAVHIHGKPDADVHIHGKEKEAEKVEKEKTAVAAPTVSRVRERLEQRKTTRLLEGLAQRLGGIEERLKHLDEEPATPGPRKFNDDFAGVIKNLGEGNSGEGSGQIVELLKEIKDPQERERLSRVAMERFMSGVHGGGPNGQ